MMKQKNDYLQPEKNKDCKGICSQPRQEVRPVVDLGDLIERLKIQIDTYLEN